MLETPDSISYGFLNLPIVIAPIDESDMIRTTHLLHNTIIINIMRTSRELPRHHDSRLNAVLQYVPVSAGVNVTTNSFCIPVEHT
jgi:hypothetical protein